MKAHVKTYLNYFGYGEQDCILCERCGKKAVDIHHIEPKGIGGSKTKNYIENLIALCRECHIYAHSNTKIKEELKKNKL